MGKFLFFILSMLLFSCSKEKSGQGLALIKDAWKMACFQNETLVTGVIGEFEAGGMRHADSLVKAEVERIVSWRRGFASEPTLKTCCGSPTPSSTHKKNALHGVLISRRR